MGSKDVWEGYVNANWGIMEAEQDAGITRRMGKSRKTMHLPVNMWGEPILPDVDSIAESVRKIKARFPTMGARQMVVVLRQDYELRVPEYVRDSSMKMQVL